MPGIKSNNPLWSRFFNNQQTGPNEAPKEVPTAKSSGIDQWARHPIGRTEAMQRLGVNEKTGNSQILENKQHLSRVLS